MSDDSNDAVEDAVEDEYSSLLELEDNTSVPAWVQSAYDVVAKAKEAEAVKSLIALRIIPVTAYQMLQRQESKALRALRRESPDMDTTCSRSVLLDHRKAVT